VKETVKITNHHQTVLFRGYTLLLEQLTFHTTQLLSSRASDD